MRSEAGLYFAAAASTAIIILILAGIKPIEEAYRARVQTARLKIEASTNSLTPEILKAVLSVRTGQIKRFLVTPAADGVDSVSIVLSKVSSHDLNIYKTKLEELDGITQVSIVAKGTDI